MDITFSRMNKQDLIIKSTTYNLDSDSIELIKNNSYKLSEYKFRAIQQKISTYANNKQTTKEEKRY